MDKSQPMSFVKAAKDYFDIKSETAVAEIKPLTDADKIELVEGLRKEGYNITPDEKGRW